MLWGLVIWTLSWATVSTAIWLGRQFIAPGPGYPKSGEIQTDLFRFDALYYFAIAESGYSYDGDPGSSPNVVFAPAFPLLVRAIHGVTGMDLVPAGLLLNELLLYGSLVFLQLALVPWIGLRRTLMTLVALSTAAGAYSLHAFYSESTMLALLSLSLFAIQRDRPWLLAIASAAMSASRLTALPVGIALAVWQILRSRGHHFGGWVRAAVSLSGGAAYLACLWYWFGNPFTLIPQIQSVSWGRFHQETPWEELLTGERLWVYGAGALERGLETFLDIRTLNLGWMLLGLTSICYLVAVWRKHPLTYIFVPYMLFVYVNAVGSEYVISAHRFTVLMLPVFILFTSVPRWPGIILLILNLGYGMLHAAQFNQGAWYWF